jgi:thiol-disulfide isomerase/thioredoxin
MKKYLSAFILFTLMLPGCRSVRTAVNEKNSGSQAAEKPAGPNFSDPVTWLMGYINPDRFLKPPYSEWFLKGFNDYQPVQEVIGKLALINKGDISIKIVLGTWCPDSRREVPRFMKIIDLWGFPSEKLIFVGVDNSKIAPVGGYDTLAIERVPTFIFLQNKVETGRIIENPVTSLEQDMLNILTRNEN